MLMHKYIRPGGQRWGLAVLLASLTVAPVAVRAQDAPPPPPDGEEVAPIPDMPPDGPPEGMLPPPPEGMPPLPPEGPGRPRLGPGPGAPGRGGAMIWSRMSDDEKEKFRQFLADNFPDRFGELTDLEERDPQRFTGMIGRILPEMLRLRELKQRDPQAFETRKGEMISEFNIRRLSRRYRAATDDKAKASLEKEIHAAVEEHFDLRTTRETQELAHLEERIGQLKQRSADRQSKRDEIVERVVSDVLAGRPAGPELEGGPPPGKPPLGEGVGPGDEGQGPGPAARQRKPANPDDGNGANQRKAPHRRRAPQNPPPGD